MLENYWNRNFSLENQFDGKNSHDELNPIESADVIVGSCKRRKNDMRREQEYRKS
jgi:membrane-associated HD superfamily phosphohydrolase